MFSKAALCCAISLLVTSAMGCEENSSLPDSSKMEKEVGEAWDATSEYFAEQRDAFVESTREELGQLDDRLALLRAKAEEATGDAQAVLKQQIGELEEECASMDEHLEQLSADSEEAWEEAKRSIKTSLGELRDRIDNAIREDETSNG